MLNNVFIMSNTILPIQSTAKPKIATFRFTLTPEMEKVFQKLEKKYAMLDRTEIVKLGVSMLNNSLDNPQSNDDSSNAGFDNFDQAMEFWNANKNEFRV